MREAFGKKFKVFVKFKLYRVHHLLGGHLDFGKDVLLIVSADFIGDLGIFPNRVEEAIPFGVPAGQESRELRVPIAPLLYISFILGGGGHVFEMNICPPTRDSKFSIVSRASWKSIVS